MSLSTATNWAFNWIVGEVTPYLQEVLEWKLYPLFGFFCVCSFILGTSISYSLAQRAYAPLVYYLYPETMGVPLEEMDSVFGESKFT